MPPNVDSGTLAQLTRGGTSNSESLANIAFSVASAVALAAESGAGRNATSCRRVTGLYIVSQDCTRASCGAEGSGVTLISTKSTWLARASEPLTDRAVTTASVPAISTANGKVHHVSEGRFKTR